MWNVSAAAVVAAVKSAAPARFLRWWIIGELVEEWDLTVS
jgi:hypothetical protein